MKDLKMSQTLIFDIETNGLLLDVDTFHVGYTYCIETKEYMQFRSPYSMVEALNNADLIVAHNGIGYDLPALYILTKQHVTTEVVDTYLLSKLAYYDQDRSFSHSLDAHGQRLGYHKGHHTDWSRYSEEMDVYCKRDVEVTYKLYQHLKRKTPWLPKEALDLEQDVQRIVTQQYLDGWMFDVKKGEQLHVELLGEYEKALLALHTTFKPKFLPKGKEKTPTKPFRRNGVYTVGTHQPIEYTIFNPGSGNHIIWWVERTLGEQDWKRTEKGTAKTDAETLMEMFSEEEFIKPLLKYQEVKKILGQLAEGDKAWLKMVHTDGRLHGSADILGAVTGRFTHSNPNLAQVPSVRAYKGKEARSLFTVPNGYKLVGCDASGLELRTLSHYLARYDEGKYGNTILEGDIHTANQDAAGLPTRDMAKTFIYGFLYGAGDAKIGQIVNGTQKDGKKLKDTFTSKTKGLKGLLVAVKLAAKKGYLKGLSGRRLYVRSPHSALNTLLQSAGAYYMKYVVVELNKRLQQYDAKFVGNIHDEFQIQVREDQADIVASMCEQVFIDVGEHLNMRIKMEGEAKIGNNWYDTH